VIAQLLEKVAFKLPSGILRTLQCEKVEQYSFLDYILNGLEIALIIAIDFTGSNGSPTHPDSLHNIDMGTFSFS